MNKVILLEPALFDFYILLFFKFAKRQVGPIKRQSSQYCVVIGHALNQSHTSDRAPKSGHLSTWDLVTVGRELFLSKPVRVIGGDFG